MFEASMQKLFFCCYIDLFYAELYEGLGGNLVDGLPPVLSLRKRSKRRNEGVWCGRWRTRRASALA
eukprot:2004473-Pyramimonas_sp.AAC.1